MCFINIFIHPPPPLNACTCVIRGRRDDLLSCLYLASSRPVTRVADHIRAGRLVRRRGATNDDYYSPLNDTAPTSTRSRFKTPVRARTSTCRPRKSSSERHLCGRIRLWCSGAVEPSDTDRITSRETLRSERYSARKTTSEVPCSECPIIFYVALSRSVRLGGVPAALTTRTAASLRTTGRPTSSKPPYHHCKTTDPFSADREKRLERRCAPGRDLPWSQDGPSAPSSSIPTDAQLYTVPSSFDTCCHCFRSCEK